MPRKTNGECIRQTANQTISQPIAVEPIEAENPFQLDEMIDVYAQPIASEAIRQRLPERVKHHVNRLLISDNEADRAELLEIMKSAKLGICFSVYHAVLAYARESSQSQIGGSTQESLPAASKEE